MHHITATFKQIGLLTIALTLALVANFSYGQWVNPTVAPTGGNIEAPVNTSDSYQIKPGPLGVNELIADSRVRSNQYCDFAGNNCFAASATAALVNGGGGGGGGIGDGQTWQVINRSQGVWYQNTTGRPIMVFHKNIFDGTSISIGVTPGSAVEMNFQDFDSDLDNGSTIIVPTGNWYRMNTGTENSWNGHRQYRELR
jgi:hypothetical protein